MYKLDRDEQAELGQFLRTLCRMGLVGVAKVVASMSDIALSQLIREDKLWTLINASDREEDDRA